MSRRGPDFSSLPLDVLQLILAFAWERREFSAPFLGSTCHAFRRLYVPNSLAYRVFAISSYYPLLVRFMVVPPVVKLMVIPPRHLRYKKRSCILFTCSRLAGKEATLVGIDGHDGIVKVRQQGTVTETGLHIIDVDYLAQAAVLLE